jgi:hypothetical protein
MTFKFAWNVMKADRMNVLEGFAGAGGNDDILAGWSQAARDRGHNTLRNEIMHLGNTEEPWANYDLGYTPELPGNILNYSALDIVNRLNGKTPDVAFFSPPCEGHSVSARMQGWLDWAGQKKKKDAFNRARNTGDAEFFQDPSVGPTPGNEPAVMGRKLMNHTLKLIDDLQDYRMNIEGRDADDPMYWWVENPTGMMRYQPEMGMRPLAQPPGTNLKGSAIPNPSITHASYSGPFAEEILGMPRHDIPGHPAIPSRKPTDLWTNAGDIWLPRPHTKRGLHPDAPVFDQALDELQSIYGKRVESVPRREDVRSFGDAGLYHAWGPRGAKTGTQGIKPLTLPNGVKLPQYHMKSLIPYGLGLDAIIAVERARAGETTPYPMLQRRDEVRPTSLFDFQE